MPSTSNNRQDRCISKSKNRRHHAFACYNISHLGCSTRTGNSSYLQYELNDHLVKCIAMIAVRFRCSQPLKLSEIGVFQNLKNQRHAFACYNISDLGCSTRTGNSSYLQYELNKHFDECIEMVAVRFRCSQPLKLSEIGVFQNLKNRPHTAACFRVFLHYFQ